MMGAVKAKLFEIAEKFHVDFDEALSTDDGWDALHVLWYAEDKLAACPAVLEASDYSKLFLFARRACRWLKRDPSCYMRLWNAVGLLMIPEPFWIVLAQADRNLGNSPSPNQLTPQLVEALRLAEATIVRLNRHDSANGTLDVVRAAIARAGN